MLTKTSNDLIQHFIKKSNMNEYLKSQNIKHLYESLNNNYKNSKIITKIDYNEYPYSDNNFIAKTLKNKLSVHQKVYSYQWTTNNKYSVKNILNIYQKENNNTLPNIELLIKAISYITSFSNKNRNITIHLCLLNDKKILRKNSQNLTPLNINSGSNTFNDINSEICIFRKEECIKLIFHEVIHGLRLSNLSHNDGITEILCQKYDLQSKEILIDESYTEIWAKILNIFFITSLMNSPTKYQNFCTMLAIEKEFSLYQGNKIKAFIKKSKNKNLDKDTNVSAYFLVVAEIFSNLDKFLMNCNKNLYINDHQKCLNYFYNLNMFDKRRVNINDKFYNSLRMSVCELII